MSFISAKSRMHGVSVANRSCAPSDAQNPEIKGFAHFKVLLTSPLAIKTAEWMMICLTFFSKKINFQQHRSRHR